MSSDGMDAETHMCRISNGRWAGTNLKHQILIPGQVIIHSSQEVLLAMPIEVSDKEEFLNLSQKASECRVKRLKDVVKLKLRTPRHLYTIKLDEETAEEVLREIKCPIIDV